MSTTGITHALHVLSRIAGIPRWICPRAGHYTVHVRTPDDPERWTAWGEQPIGRPYTYVSGDVSVYVEFHEDDEV